MPRYLVEVSCVGSEIIEVYADSAREAQSLALEDFDANASCNFYTAVNSVDEEDEDE